MTLVIQSLCSRLISAVLVPSDGSNVTRFDMESRTSGAPLTNTRHVPGDSGSSMTDTIHWREALNGMSCTILCLDLSVATDPSSRYFLAKLSRADSVLEPTKV